MSPSTAAAPTTRRGAVLPGRDSTVEPDPITPWLWGDRHGALSCGAAGCSLPRRDYHPLTAGDLAELSALAEAHRTTLRCRCGAVQYDPASRTVRERS